MLKQDIKLLAQSGEVLGQVVTANERHVTIITMSQIVWLMGLIYELFFAIPCKRPHILVLGLE